LIKLMEACLLGSMLLMLGVSCAVTFEFGSKVEVGDSDLGRLLYNCCPSVGFWDTNINPGVYDQSDVVYLHMNPADSIVDANDIRLSSYNALPAGSKVTSEDNDINKLLTPLPGSKIVFLQMNGDPRYSLDDAVYLHINGLTNSTQPNDIRLTKVAGMAAGTKVINLHPDNNMPINPLLDFPVPPGGPIATIRFFNANGNYNATGVPVFDYPDVLYLDVSIPGTVAYGSVSVNDVRLSL
jgi:hypothetical protein